MVDIFCVVVEVYMIDFSWEDDVESWCEVLIIEVIMLVFE